MKYKLIYLLPFLAGLNGLPLNIVGNNVRIDQVASIIIFILLIIALMTGKQQFIKDQSIILLVLFLSYTLVVTLLFAPDVKYSFIQTLSFISVAIIFVSISNSIKTDLQLNKLTKYFIFAGIIHCTVGVLFFILSILGLMDYGANLIDDLTTPYGAYGTMVEPNIYGGYCLGYFIFSFTLASTSKTQRGPVLFLLSTSFLGLFLSFTRGVWIAACIGLLLVLFYPKKARRINVTRISFLLVIIIILYVVASTLSSNYYLTYKISNLFEMESGSGLYRIVMWSAAFDNIKSHPFFGTGTYSFATIMGDGSYGPRTSPWIGNIFITLLHDYGIIGFIIFTLFFVSLVIKSLKLFRIKDGIIEEDKWILLALSLSIISLYICYFFTMGSSLAYSWIFLGLLTCYKRKVENKLIQSETVFE